MRQRLHSQPVPASWWQRDQTCPIWENNNYIGIDNMPSSSLTRTLGCRISDKHPLRYIQNGTILAISVRSTISLHLCANPYGHIFLRKRSLARIFTQISSYFRVLVRHCHHISNDILHFMEFLALHRSTLPVNWAWYQWYWSCKPIKNNNFDGHIPNVYCCHYVMVWMVFRCLLRRSRPICTTHGLNQLVQIST